MIATMRRLRQGGPVPARLPSKAPGTLFGLLHVALGMVFLSTLLSAPLVPCLVIGTLGLLCCLAATGGAYPSPARMPLLLLAQAGVATAFWVAHANGAAIPGWLTVSTAVLLLVVVPSSLAGRD